MDTASPSISHDTLAADASSLKTEAHQDERAAKRLKIRDPSDHHGGGPEMQGVPGEGLHDAALSNDSNGDQQNHISAVSNGSSNSAVRDRVRGVVPIKKE
jgi:hypothetical protein